MTNALVEVGLISISVFLGTLGLPLTIVAVMVGVSLSWWGFVHHARFVGMMRANAIGAAGALALALIAMILGHGIGYGLGGAFHAMMGL